MKYKISIEDALIQLLKITYPVSPASVLLPKAVGCVLSEDIIANRYIPPFDRSAVDGYALNSLAAMAASSRPVIFNIVDGVKADTALNPSFSSASCIRVGTGEPIPDWVDTVIKYEEAEISGKQVLIGRPLPSGDNIILRGEDVKPGDRIATRGTRINAPLVAIFAGLGMSMVPVYRTVKIAFLSNGNEIVGPADELPPGKVFNSNFYGLAARCYELDTQPVNLGIAPDCIETVAKCITTGLASADLVVTTGGISVDESDVMVAALKETGATMLFQGIDMKPGSPTLAATKNGQLIIGLSGNPAASMVSFELIVLPVIKRIMGLTSVLPLRFKGIMGDAFEKNSPQRRLLRGRLYQHQNTNFVELTGNQGNAALTSLIRCNALIDIPAGSGPIISGQAVSGFLIG